MARRFLEVCAGIFLLVVSYELGASQANGQVTSFRMLSPYAALVGSTVYVLETTNAPLGWRALPYTGWDLPPVPPSSLVSYYSGIAVTDQGEGWDRQGSGWVSLGTLPGLVPVQRPSWGQLKAKYAR